MNRRAAALGLAATHFENPCGHDAPGHRASARDLLALTRAFLAVPALRDLAAREKVEVVTRGGRRMTATTKNSLLGRVRGLTGVKTGTTEAAGRCVIARVEREGSEVVVVLLDAPDRWFTAAALVEAAFREGRRG
jgi:D-alanyl-D-alanine carboxypeptidase (penicillin-binding protein 5/6)